MAGVPKKVHPNLDMLGDLRLSLPLYSTLGTLAANSVNDLQLGSLLQ